jgi:hypothetical protein
LETLADVRRFIRWTILSARNQSMTTGQAAVFGQLAMTLTKVIQESDLEQRLQQLERSLRLQQHPSTNGVLRHDNT